MNLRRIVQSLITFLVILQLFLAPACDADQGKNDLSMLPALFLLLSGVDSQPCASRGLPGPEVVTYAGRQWQRCDDGNLYDWEAAKTYCSNLTLAGYSDWHLPTKTELKSLVVCTNGTPTPLKDYDPVNNANHPYWCGDGNTAPYDNPTIDKQFSCHSNDYWSSSVHDAGTAWIVRFINGQTEWPGRTLSYYVRCVR